MKKAITYVVVMLVIVLGLCEVAVRVLTVRNGHVDRFLNNKEWFLAPYNPLKHVGSTDRFPGAYRRYDEKLGWTIAEGGKDEPLYFSSASGFRVSEREFRMAENSDFRAEESNYTAVAIGDSFTHGDEVIYEESWPYLLGQKLNIRVLNMGVGGYGVDQAVMKYEIERIESRYVILGLIVGDLDRAECLVYNLATGGTKTKPRYLFEGDGIEPTVMNQPCLSGNQLREEFHQGISSDFLRSDCEYHELLFKKHWYDASFIVRLLKGRYVRKELAERKLVYESDDQRLDDSMKIIRYLKHLTDERESDLLVVMMGHDNKTFTSRLSGSNAWRYIERRLDALGIQYINTSYDMHKQFEENRDLIINAGGVHYTGYANNRVAEMIAESNFIAGTYEQPV